MKLYAAASQNILDLRRCSCNTLKVEGISEPPHPPASVCRTTPNGSSPLSTDLRLPNPRRDLRIRRSGTIARTEHPTFDHPKLDTSWSARRDFLRSRRRRSCRTNRPNRKAPAPNGSAQSGSRPPGRRASGVEYPARLRTNSKWRRQENSPESDRSDEEGLAARRGATNHASLRVALPRLVSR